MAKANPKIPDLVKRTVNPTPMQMVDDEGISELISLAQSGPDGGTLNSESILAELKPFIKHAQPKPVLAGLKVLEEMMRNCTRKFHVCIAGDEWMRRLGKLVLNSNEPVLKSTVLQLLADWQEAYKNDPELSAISKKIEELQGKGCAVPQASPEIIPKRDVKAPQKGGYEERINRLIDSSPMATLDEEGIQELCLLVLATDEQGVTSVLKALKPRIKDLKHPKHCLAGLTILDELVKRCPSVHAQIATDDWTKRLLKLHEAASENVIKQKILQLMVNWREAFKLKPELAAISRACAQLFSSGVTLPPVSDTTLVDGSMSTSETVDSEGKVVKMGEKDKEKKAKGPKSDAKQSAMYSCHDDSDFGQVHWTLDLLLQSSSAADTVWNPVEAVRGVDAPTFVGRLSEVGIGGPPSVGASTATSTVPENSNGGGGGGGDTSNAEVFKIKQNADFFKNKSSALEAKVKRLEEKVKQATLAAADAPADSPAKAIRPVAADIAPEDRLNEDGIDIAAQNEELQQLVADLQQQMRTLTEAKTQGAEGETKLLMLEMNEYKKKAKDFEAKVKAAETELADARSAAEAAQQGGSSATKALESQLKKESAAKREMEAELDELKGKMEADAQAAAGNLEGTAAEAAEMARKVESTELELSKEKRRVEELELELDMLNAEKSQLVAKVGKVSGAKFTSSMLAAKSGVTMLKDDHSTLRVFARDSLKQMSDAIGTIESTLVQQLKLSESLVGGAVREREELRELYRVECKKRKKLYNELQDLQGNLRVYCRIRPIRDSEREVQGEFNIEQINEEKDELRIMEQGGKGVGKRKFEFDQVFAQDSSQELVFSCVEPLIGSILDGYNVCIFAYGQTGSGKTFTMEGPVENPGVSLRAVQRIFDCLAERTEEEDSEVHLSMLEVYNEELKDLLDPRKKKMDISMDKVHGTVIAGLEKLRVANSKEVSDAVQRGQSSRAVKATNMNAHSSRSHLILRLYVALTNKTSGDVTHSKLSLVDLAGSERVGKSGAEGDALKEAQGINKSLSALGNVVRCLATGQGHCPYRNSKLTHALSDSIGGNSKTLMFCNISPRELDVPETLCALNFAVQAKEVKSGPVKKQSSKKAS